MAGKSCSSDLEGEKMPTRHRQANLPGLCLPLLWCFSLCCPDINFSACLTDKLMFLVSLCAGFFCQAIIACRCQRAAPTLTTIFEIAALTAPLIKVPQDANQPGSSSAAGTDAGYTSDTHPTDSSSSNSRQSGQHGPEAVLQPPGLTHALVVLALRCARGWAPAVVVAQGVRLVGSLVQRREQPHEEARQEGSEGTF